MTVNIIVFLVSLLTPTSASQAPLTSGKDLSVHQAVLAEAIRRADRSASRGAVPSHAPIVAVDRTLALCRPHDALMDCIEDRFIQSFQADAANTRAPRFADLLTPMAREELGNSFRERNRDSHPVSDLTLDRVILVSREKLTQVLKDESNWMGISRLSQPAYSTDGHALVYASYWCGDLCGYGVFVLLERRGDSWQVISTETLWMS